MANPIPKISPPQPSAHNPPGFAQLLLNDLNIPVTQGRLAFLYVWFDNEGNDGPPGNNGVNNPLNVSPGGSVANYSTPQEGAQATAAVIQQSNFSKIYDTLANPNASPAAMAAAVETSPWASGHYHAYDSNGNYVGGNLIKPFLPPGVKSPDIVGIIGHYIAHPGAGIGATGAAAAAPVTKAASGVEGAVITAGKDILYGVIMVVCVLVFLVGVLLIGADIGIGILARNKATKTIGGAYSRIGGTVRRQPNAEQQHERATTAAYKTGIRQGQISRARSEGRKEGAGRMEKQKVTVMGDYQAKRRAERKSAMVNVKGPGELPADY